MQSGLRPYPVGPRSRVYTVPGASVPGDRRCPPASRRGAGRPALTRRGRPARRMPRISGCGPLSTHKLANQGPGAPRGRRPGRGTRDCGIRCAAAPGRIVHPAARGAMTDAAFKGLPRDRGMPFIISSSH
eukprot:4435-Hanusia_phi.AAC.1